MGDIVGSGWSWWWAKAGCEWWAFSGQLLTRVLKGVVTANGTVGTKEVIPLELSILSWLLGGITKGRSLVADLRGVCMRWGEGIYEDFIVQAIPWQVCILPSSLAEQAVILDACLRCELPEKHCHEGLLFHQG